MLLPLGVGSRAINIKTTITDNITAATRILRILYFFFFYSCQNFTLTKVKEMSSQQIGK